LTATASIPNTGETKLSQNGAQIRAHVGVALAAIGDTHTAQFAFLYQVDALTMAATDVASTSATRTYTAQFRWGADGSTWSAWLTFDTVTVAAITPTANNRFYIEIRITRTGSDIAGTITWNYATFNLTRDPLAFVGHGVLTSQGLQGELQNLLQAAIQSQMVTTPGGAARFAVVLSYADSLGKSKNLLPVYLYNLRRIGEEDMRIGGTLNQDRWEITIATKTIVENQGPTTQGVTMVQDAMGKIREMFSPRSAYSFRYSLTFKTVAFIDTPWTNWGISNFQIEDRGFRAGDSDEYQEFRLNFTVDISRLYYGNSSF